MTIARSAQFDVKDPPWIHAISRCVRKAFLCGGREGKYDHRRDWVEERLAYLLGGGLCGRHRELRGDGESSARGAAHAC
jgi:hypothetical protein